MREAQELVRRAASSFGFMKLAKRKNKISFFIGDWHSDLRHRSGFEPPLSQFGISRNGKTCVAICISSQATTA